MANKTFKTFDKFDLEPFADQLTKYLKIESQFVEGSFVLSLNSEFGSGKTTFLEMWKEKLQEENSAKVVLLNSWQSDFHGDALLAIVSGLLDALGSTGNESEKELIKETAGKLCKFALSIGNDIVKNYTGIDVIEAGNKAEPKTKLGQACFEVYHEKQKIFDELKSQLNKITEKSEEPIIIIIDELDRCRPTYAIEFLETIKHFFDIDGLIFILGVDKVQLESSAKALFGQGLVFEEYYRKFAHRNIGLPVKTPEMINKFCTKLINEYLSLDAFKKRNRFSYIKYEDYNSKAIATLCKQFSLNARQMHELFRIAAHIFSVVKETNNFLLWGWHIGAFFITTLSIKDIVYYHRIGKKNITLKEFTEFLQRNILSQSLGRHSFWWSVLLYLGLFPEEPLQKLENEFISLKVWDNKDKVGDAFKNELGSFYGAYVLGGYGTKPVFCEIYEKLEQLKTFEQL